MSGEVSDLNSALSGIEKYIVSKNLFDNSNTTIGYLNVGTGNIDTSITNRKTSIFMPVIPGKYLTISTVLVNGQQKYDAPSICFFDASKTLISGGGTWKSTLVVPVGAAFARVSVENNDNYRQVEMTDDGNFTTYEAYFEPYYILNPDVDIPTGQIVGLDEHLAVLDENVEEINTIQSDISDISERVTYDRFDVYTEPYHEGGVYPSGDPAAVYTWYHTDKIPVLPGEVLKGVTTDHTQSVIFKRLCAYNDDTPIVAKGLNYEAYTYTVPDGINYVVVTQQLAPSGKVTSVEITGTNDMTKQIIPKIPYGYMRDAGDMDDGDILHVQENNVKNQVVVAFSGNITSFDKLLVGQRKANNSAMESCYIEIDDTNVVIHTDQGNITNEHGLTILNDIQVQIETKNETSTSLIRIVSSGDVYEDTAPHRWICDVGFAAAVSDGSVLTDCALSWTSRNINKPIWIFGDSYVSLYDVRWVYWLIQDGFDKSCLINGFAGENSLQASKSLTNLIEIAKPIYIVWALGMNDGDSSSAVNASWDENYRKMISICKQNGITPILATIPNVPTVNNNYKNAIIRNSGYRYIEFSKAVDPDEDGNWISGALSADGVHPSVKGAKILYMRALVDFPELMSN